MNTLVVCSFKINGLLQRNDIYLVHFSRPVGDVELDEYISQRKMQLCRGTRNGLLNLHTKMWQLWKFPMHPQLYGKDIVLVGQGGDIPVTVFRLRRITVFNTSFVDRLSIWRVQRKKLLTKDGKWHDRCCFPMEASCVES